jgi:uncharacterized protein (DUF305 family)
MIRSMFRATVTLLTVPLLLLPLAGCGGDDAEPRPALTTETARNGDVYNTADVEFATAMIPLQAEAMAMVDLTVDRDLSPEAQAVAEEIELSAPVEIEEMTGWLQSWDKPIPETVRDHLNAGHDHGDEGAEGDHDQPSEELQELADADDAEFERLFLEHLADNHEEAIAAATAGEAEGTFDPAVELAESLKNAHEQRAEEIDALLAE